MSNENPMHMLTKVVLKDKFKHWLNVINFSFCRTWKVNFIEEPGQSTSIRTSIDS